MAVVDMAEVTAGVSMMTTMVEVEGMTEVVKRVGGMLDQESQAQLYEEVPRHLEPDQLVKGYERIASGISHLLDSKQSVRCKQRRLDCLVFLVNHEH